MADTSLVQSEGGAITLPDLSEHGNIVRFATLWGDGKVAKLPPEEQSHFLAAVGNYIGVRAELGEIMLYQGKPYITIDGRIRVAHASGLLDGIDVGPASQMEVMRYGCQDGDYLWKCLVWKKGARKPFVGWGHVGKADRNPVAKTHPRELAKKRAKYDALRLAFPPKEEITGLHEKYIDEAEQMAAQANRLPDALLNTEEPDDASVAAEEAAADFTVDTTEGTTEQAKPEDEQRDAPAPNGPPSVNGRKKMPFGNNKGKALGDLEDDVLISTIEWCRDKNATKFADLITACQAVLREREEGGNG